MLYNEGSAIGRHDDHYDAGGDGRDNGEDHRLTGRRLRRTVETARGSVPRSCFVLRQINEIHVHRQDRSYLTKKFPGPGRKAGSCLTQRI